MQYTLIKLWQDGWSVLPVILIAVGLLCALMHDPIRPKEIVSHKYHPLKGKRLLYFCALLFLICCIAVNCMEIPLSGSATISLNYDGASRGLNPNSTRFNQADMLSDEILERVIRLGRFSDVSAGDLRDAIEITPVDKGSSDDGSYRVATEYKVKYRAKRKVSGEDAETILQLYCGCYKEWFKKQYSYNMDSLEVDFDLIEKEDYLDMCDYFDKAADRISSFMSSMSEKEAKFESSTGETFHTVGARANNLKSSLIQDLRAYLLNAGIAKDATTFMGRLTVANIFMTFDAYRYESANENRLNAISKYANDMARVVLIPTYDMDGQFYMSQTKTGIDNFAEDAENYASTRNSVDSKIANNSYIFNQFDREAISEAALGKANDLVSAIEEELADVAADARTAVQEYDEKQSNGYLSYSIAESEDRIKSAIRDAIFDVFIVLVVALADLSILEIKRGRKGRADAK